jgi:RimJ/RimL family protein N-acetyltransferase
MWGRRSREREAQTQTQGNPQPAAVQSPPIILRPMTEAEFLAFKAFMYDEYAADIARGMAVPIDEVRERATQQIDDLLKDGLASDAHFLWKIVAEADPNGAAGDLWAYVDRAKQRAFIYFIGIDEQYRGKGYARAAMLALEAEMRPLGATRIELSVFGDNTTARRLYESLGYQPSAIHMRKDL